MKKQTIILLILLIISIAGNLYLLSENNKLKTADEKQLQVFTEDSDSLNAYRLKYREDWKHY